MTHAGSGIMMGLGKRSSIGKRSYQSSLEDTGTYYAEKNTFKNIIRGGAGMMMGLGKRAQLSLGG